MDENSVSLAVIRKGDYLGKYGRQGSMKCRFFILSKDGQRLEFKGRGQHRIPFKSVMLVAPGRESVNFKSKDGDLHRTDPAKFRALSSLSFSVHYYDVDGFSRSLDLQCIGNNEHKTSAEGQYVAWFNGLSMLVHVVRTYEHIPQAILSQDIMLSPSPLSGTNDAGTGSVASSTTHTSGGGQLAGTPKQHQDQLVSQHLISRPSMLERDDSGSTLSQATHSTEADNTMQRNTQQANTPGSSVSASDSAAYGRRKPTPFSMSGPWPGPAAPPRPINTQDSVASQQETHVVFSCGHDALGGAGAQPSTALARLEAFSHVDTQQVIMSARSVACIDGAGQMYMAGTTADGEHFPTAAKLPCLNNQKVVQAACAHSAVFALAETGRVLAWGRCASGLLGMTSRVAVFSPKALKFLTSGPSPREVAVRFLAAGVHHCAAISDGSLLFTWGDGAYGRLGHGNMDSCFEPRVVSSLQQRCVSTVSCGAYHTAAVCLELPGGDGEGSVHRTSPGGQRNGTLYTWGGAFDIQTAMGSATTSSNEGCLGLPMLQRHEGVVKPHPVELANVVDVACGLNFTVAADVGGAVYQMGSMLREGEVPGCPWEGAPEPTRVKGELVDAHVTHVSAGTSHVIAAARSLRDSHAADKPPSLVFTWGANDKGQLARSIQVPAQRRGGNDMHATQMEQMLCLTPGAVVDMRGVPVSGIIASADSTAVVAAVPPEQSMGKSSSSGRLARLGSETMSPGGKGLTQNPAMKFLRQVRTNTGSAGKAAVKDNPGDPPALGGHQRSASMHAPSTAGMVVLDSTMPSSTWVNPNSSPPINEEGLRADGPRMMHVGTTTAAAVVPGGMSPLPGPLAGISPLPGPYLMETQRQQPMTLAHPVRPKYEAVQDGGLEAPSSLPMQVNEDAPQPATAYASTAEMMRRLNCGGPMRTIGAVPAAAKTDEKAAAINDRIAWLERVINDRNMEVSLAGAPDPDDEVGSTSAGTPLAHPAHADEDGTEDLEYSGSMQHSNHASQQDLHDQMNQHNHHFANAHLPDHQQHAMPGSGQPPTERNVQEWKAEIVAAAQLALMNPPAEEGGDDGNNALSRALTSEETMPLYHMPNGSGGNAMHGEGSHMSGPAADGYVADASTGEVGGQFGDMHGLSGATDGDVETSPGVDLDKEGDLLDGQSALDDLEQRHLILQQTGLPSISEQPDRNESDTSGTVTGNLGHTHEQLDFSRGGVAPPASTQAASHTAGTVGTGTDILSTSSLPGGLTFLNAGTPQPQPTAMPPTNPPTNPHYNLAAASATASTAGSITSDPFSNVWQQLQQRPPSVQLLSLSSSVAGGSANAGANARVQDNTSQMAELRLEVEKLQKELAEEKSSHKALQIRTLELRTRLSHTQYEPPNKQSPGDSDNADVAERFKSLVERNPVVVDSFWVPVDDGVSARLDVAEYTGLGKLKFSSRLFDNRAVKEWYKNNKHRVEVGSLVSGLAGVNASLTGPYAATHGINGTGANNIANVSLPEVARSSEQSSRRASDQSTGV